MLGSRCMMEQNCTNMCTTPSYFTNMCWYVIDCSITVFGKGLSVLICGCGGNYKYMVLVELVRYFVNNYKLTLLTSIIYDLTIFNPDTGTLAVTP